MKIFIFLFTISIIFFGIYQLCQAVDFQLNIKYPPVPGAQEPSSTSNIPSLINYIYKISLALCGITALISILIGAFRYASAGSDSSKVGDAKDQITQALLGLLILLAAVLILRTINPDLVSFKL